MESKSGTISPQVNINPWEHLADIDGQGFYKKAPVTAIKRSDNLPTMPSTDDEIGELNVALSKYFSEDMAKEFKPLIKPTIYAWHDPELDRVNGFEARKVGDTRQQFPEVRVNQWRENGYPYLVRDFFHDAFIDYNGERYYYRDYHVHSILREWGYVQLEAGNTGNPTYGDVIIPNTITAKKLSQEFYVKRSDPTQPITREIIEKAHQRLYDSVVNGNMEYALPTSLDSRGSVVRDFSDLPVQNFAPYEYQAEAARDIVEKLMAQEGETKRVLLDAPTRSGKTATILWAVKELFAAREAERAQEGPQGALSATFSSEVGSATLPAFPASEKRLVVITTAIVDVLMEFKELLQRHEDFRASFTYLDRAAIAASWAIGEDAIAHAWSDYDVVFTGVSLQDLGGRRSEGSLKSIHGALDGRVNLVIGDECHVGMFGDGEVYKEAVSPEIIALETKEMTQRELDEYNAEQEGLRAAFSLNPREGYIFSSATTYNILGTSFFHDDAIIFISQEEVDAQAEATNAEYMKRDGHTQNSPFHGKTVRHFFALEGTGEEYDIAELTKAIASKEGKGRGSFIHRVAQENFADAIFGLIANDRVPSIFSDAVLRAAGCGRHILLKAGSKLSCDAWEDYFKDRCARYPEVFPYKVMNISSTEEKGFTAKDMAEIKGFISKNRFERTIIITVNRASTGISIPEIDTVFMACGGDSLTRRVQSYGRCTTPWNETVDYRDGGEKVRHCMKPNSFVIECDPARLYEVANDAEIHRRMLSDKERSTRGDSSGERETALGNIISFSGLTVRKMSRLDIHRQLEGYVQNKRVDQIVDDLPLDLDADEVFISMGNQEEVESAFRFSMKEEKGKVTLTMRGEELLSRAFATAIDSTPEKEGGSTDGVDEDGDSTSEDAGKKLLMLSRAYQRMIHRRVLLFSLLHGEVQSLQEVAQLLHEVAGENTTTLSQEQVGNKRLFSNVGLLTHAPMVQALAKNYVLLDSMERGIKALRAKCFGEDGAPSVDGFLSVVSGIARLSPNEIFTPRAVGDLLVEKLAFTREDYQEFAASGKGVIDVGSKEGIPLLAFWENLLSNVETGVDEVALGARFYAIPSSPMAYEFNRVIFTMMGWSVENIIFQEGLSALETLELVKEAIPAAVSLGA